MTETKVRRRSYSALTVYEKCPEQYRIKYVERVPEEPSVWSIGGTAFHQVAEWYLAGLIGTSEADLFQAWLEAWEQAKAEVLTRNPEANPDVRTWRAADRGRENAEWWMEHGFAMVKRFVAWWPTSGLTVYQDEEGLGLERRIETELGGVPIVAIPDALVVDEHGQLNILDYKSGKPPKETLQLGVYRAAVLAGMGLDTTWGLYYMARAAQLLPTQLAKHDPLAIAQQFTEFDAGVNAGEFEPTPSTETCKFCPYKRRECRYYNPPEGP